MADGSVTIDVALEKDKLEKAVDSIDKDNSKLKKSFTKLGSIATTAFTGITVAVGAVSTALVAGATAGAKYNATIEQYKTSFEVMTGSAEKATEVVEKLKKLGAETPFEMTDLADTTQLLMNYGLTADDAISKMQMLGDISQGSAEKMGRIAMAYGQMSSAGKVSLEDIKQMIEAGFNPLQEISQTTGESMSSLYDRISKGTITVDEITASMERSTSAGGKYFQSMQKQSQTVNGQLSTLKDNASQLLGTLTEGFSTTLGGTVLPMINEMVGSLQTAFQTGGMEAFSAKLGEVLSNLITQLGSALPNLVNLGVNVVQNLISGIQQNLPSIAQSAIEIISTLLTGMMNMLPNILEMGIQLILQLIIGIAQQLPELIPQMVDAVMLMVGTLIDNIDLLIEAGMELIIGLALGLIEAIPRLVEKIPVIIEKLVNAITNNLPKLLQMGIELIIKLAEGLVKAIPDLVKAIPQIVNAVINGLGQLIGMVWDVGKNIVSGLWDGISNMAGWLWNKISGWCSDIFNGIKDFFGIHSPSKLFADKVGKMLGLGVGEGFDDSLGTVYKDMQRAIESENAKLTTNLTTQQVMKNEIEDSRQFTLKSLDENKEIVVNSTTNLDGKVIAREVNKVNARRKLQYGY